MARFPATRGASDCLPSWWPRIYQLLGKHPLFSGATVDCNDESPTFGVISASPEVLRANAERQLWALDLPEWPKGKKLSLDVYTEARHVASEADSIGDKMGVALGAKKRAALRGISITQLLTTVAVDGVPHRAYGPINVVCGTAKSGHKIVRWAATSRDPWIVDILIAELALSGDVDSWARGTDDQFGPGAMDAIYGAGAAKNTLRTKASRDHQYWVGPLPGVQHKKTMFMATVPGLDVDSDEGQELLRASLQALDKPDDNWLPTCVAAPGERKRKNFFVNLFVGVTAAVATASVVTVLVRTRAFAARAPRYRRA